MPAGRYDITAEQGATFKLFLEYQDSTGTAESLSGFTSRMDVKKYIGDAIITRLSLISLLVFSVNLLYSISKSYSYMCPIRPDS